MTVTLELYHQFMINVSRDIENSLLEYSHKIIHQYQSAQTRQSISISNEIFQVLFGRFLFQIVQEEVDYAIRKSYFSLFVAVRRVIQYFRIKQMHYKEIFSKLEVKCEELRGRGIDFYFFLTKDTLSFGKNEHVKLENDKIFSNYSVLFFDDRCIYQSKIESFILSNCSVVWICYDSNCHENAQFPLSIDFYSITSWNETLNKLFSNLTQVVESTVLVERKCIVAKYFESFVSNRWNLFVETDCHNPIQFGTCKEITNCLQQLIYDLHLPALSNGNLLFEMDFPICCMHHLSKHNL